MGDLSSLTRDQTRAPCSGSLESQPLDRQGSPYILTIVNNAAVNIGVHVSFQISVVFCFVFLDIYPGVELLGHPQWLPQFVSECLYGDSAVRL